MSEDASPNRMQQVASLDIWFHLPVELLDDPCARFLAGGWDEQSGAPEGLSQQTYFHRFVSEALWGSPNGSDKSALRVFRRRCDHDQSWIAERRRVDKTGTELAATQYALQVCCVEMQVLRGAGPAAPCPGLGVLSVNVSVSRTRQVPPGEEAPAFGLLTISDALDALNHLRRVFARRFHRGPVDVPENALARVFRDGGPEYRMPTRAQQRKDGAPQVAEWVAELLAPVVLDDRMAALFGDERASMTSFLSMVTPEGMTPVDAFRAIPDPVFFRLAEVDSGGEGYPAQPEFLESHRAVYFVDRHAPSPEPRADENPRNSTRWITGPNHLCGIGTGDFGTDYGPKNIRRYYRYLHLLCLLEQHRLLQFSRQIAGLVARKGELTPTGFRAELLALRGAFLEFTHRLHFNSVSAQALPEDLYARMVRVMGLARLFAGVEEELRAAADYAALQEADEVARRAERLNNVVALGVPMALVVGVLGMNILVGERFPPILDGVVCVDEHPVRYDLLQTAVVVASVLTLWYLGNRYMLRHGPETAATTERWWWAMVAAWVVVILAALFLFEVRGPCPTACPAQEGAATGPPQAEFWAIMLGEGSYA